MTVQDHLQIDIRRASGRAVICLRGELDLASVPLLARELESVDLADGATVVLDLQELEFIDSTGLRMILASQDRVRERGGGFAITRGSPQVQRLLTITRADEHLQVIGSTDQLPA